MWIAVVIIGREFLISGLRSIASSEGFTITASELGKLKTVVQIVSVVSAILAHRWDQWQIGRAGDSGEVVCDRGHLLHRGGVHHLGNRLLCRLLEEDRSRLEGSPQGRCAFAREKRPHLIKQGIGGIGIISWPQMTDPLTPVLTVQSHTARWPTPSDRNTARWYLRFRLVSG